MSLKYKKVYYKAQKVLQILIETDQCDIPEASIHAIRVIFIFLNARLLYHCDVYVQTSFDSEYESDRIWTHLGIL